VALDQQGWAASSAPPASSASSSCPLRSVGAAALVEGSVLVFDQLDAQPLGRDGDLNLLGELLQFLSRLDLLLRAFPSAFAIASLLVRRSRRSRARHRGAQQAAGSLGIVEVAGHGLLDLSLEPISQSTMNSDIMAVTKSA
jgi:hypothetical protein